MKTVYLVQVDVASGAECKTVYLPYAAGLLAAFAWKDPRVRQHFAFRGFVFERKPVREVVDQMENPCVVGFSCYVWNTEYNKLLAEEIKRRYPACVIVFGGHNVPDTSSLLEDHAYIDILVHGEGERVFKDLLLSQTGSPSLCAINNISFRQGADIIKTPTCAPGPLDDLPSPYLEGYFDDIVRSHTYTYNAIFETSRGCPHNCAYCDWGFLNAKTRQFPMDRVLAEIDWMVANKISFLWGADANFGIFRRDIAIVDALVNAKNATGYPEKMRMSYSKSNIDTVFEIAAKLKEYDFDRNGVTLSFQSFSPTVLENIGRKNMSQKFFHEVLAKYNKENIRTYSELILGLPGETPQSFKAGVGNLLELGQHFLFEIYACVLLPNAALCQNDYRERFGIRSVRAEIPRYHCEPGNLDIPEYNDLVVSTNTMSKAEWAGCLVFGYMVKAMHCSGLLRVFAIYLFYEKGVAYQTFYGNLLDYFEAHPQTFSSGVYQELAAHARSVSEGLAYPPMVFEPCGNITWNDDEYAALKLLHNKDLFYSEVREFLQSFGIEPLLFGNLLAYQQAVLREPLADRIDLTLDFDLHTYFEAVYAGVPVPMKCQKTHLRLIDTATTKDWKDYGRTVVWFGKFGCYFYKDKAVMLPTQDHVVAENE